MFKLGQVVSRRRPMRPKDDPFYDPPEDLDQLPPGTLIRSRTVRLAFLGAVPQKAMATWQLAYRSTDLHGRAELAVNTVIAPEEGTGMSPRSLVAYQCAIDAISDRCFPSYALRLGTVVPGALPPLELTLISALLEHGFVVSIADHEGRAGTFGAPREPGYRVLDGVRASLAFEALQLTPQTQVGIFGYSGGGMASAWAAEMAPEYAPELNLVGAVLGSPVGDPGGAFIKLNGTFFAGLPALVVAGLTKVYPGLGRVIDEHASEDGLRRLARLEELTTTEAVLRYRFDDFDDFLDSPLADVLALPEVLDVFTDLRLAHHIPRCPLLVLQATRDRIIDVREVDDLVERYVEGGATVRYVRDRASEHIGLMVIAQPLMMSWLEGRFAATPAPTGTVTVPSLLLAPLSWPGYVELLRSTLRLVCGRGGVVRHQASTTVPSAAQKADTSRVGVAHVG